MFQIRLKIQGGGLRGWRERVSRKQFTWFSAVYTYVQSREDEGQES